MSVYACTDFHGNLDLYNQIANFIKPEDTVYFLGDAGDRGPQPWETIKEIYKNKQFIYLKGNHEDMFVRAAKEYLYDGFWGYDYQLICFNGGEETLNGWLEEELKGDWIAAINNLPVRAEYTNKNGVTFIMTHAGFTPKEDTSPLLEELLWDREHFYDKWPEGKDNIVILHGHTPKPSLYKRLNELHEFKYGEALPEPNDGVYKYCDGHKICLDDCTIRSGRALLYNLDTLETYIFEVRD